MAIVKCPKCKTQTNSSVGRCRCGYKFPYHPDQDVIMITICENCRTIEKYRNGYMVGGDYTICPKCNNGALVKLCTPEIWDTYSFEEKQESINSVDQKTINEQFSKKFINTIINKPIEQNVPKCPTCSSTRIVKIDAIDRALSFSFWGFGSSKIGKSMQCKNCGYKW